MAQNTVNEWYDSIYTALKTYSNVHRGSGFKSQVTTHLYEKARNIALAFLGKPSDKYCVIFSSYQQAEVLQNLLNNIDYTLLNDEDTGKKTQGEEGLHYKEQGKSLT